MKNELTDEELRRTLQVLEESDGSYTEAAKKLNVARTSLYHRLDTAERRGITADPEPEIELPNFPDDDLTPEEIIEHQCKQFEKRQKSREATRWFDVKVNIEGPIGLSFIGDPHIDDNGCNWPLLKDHIDILRDTKALYACNIGDTTNNWVGRLRSLFAEQEMSQPRAYKMARWFLQDSGISWLVWLLGNHDLWNDGAEVFKQMAAQVIPMSKRYFPGDTKIAEWQAQFQLNFKNGKTCKIWAAHQFPGNSIWNSLHGLQRAAHTKEWAHIYAAGHTHNWAVHQEESASRDFIYWLIRSRGYKYIDQYAETHGHFPQKEGASITAVINPEATSEAGFIHCFPDMGEAAEFLNFLRRNYN